jgi:hypothetical protein
MPEYSHAHLFKLRLIVNRKDLREMHFCFLTKVNEFYATYRQMGILLKQGLLFCVKKWL